MILFAKIRTDHENIQFRELGTAIVRTVYFWSDMGCHV